MTAGRDPDRLIRDFFEEGLTELPDRAYDAVRSEIDHTHQRVVIGPWRLPTMNNFARYGVAAAAVVLVALLGIKFIPLGGVGPGGSTAPSPVPTHTPLPSTSASDLPQSGDLAPGSYYIADKTIPQARRFTFTVPAGWNSSRRYRTVDLALSPELVTRSTDASWQSFNASAVDSVFTDVCHWRGKTVDAGTSVDDLVTALAAQTGLTASASTSTTVDGFAATRIELTTPDQDASFCDGGNLHFWPAPGPNGDVTGLWGIGNQANVVYVLDVAGSRLVIVARHDKGSSAQDVAALDAIVASIQIEP